VTHALPAPRQAKNKEYVAARKAEILATADCNKIIDQINDLRITKHKENDQ
jgi:hypothetical protein